MNPPDSSLPSNDRDPETSELVDLDEFLAFLELTAEDAGRLRSLQSQFAAFADQFVESFYDHLFAFDTTARLLHDPDRVARLKKKQRAHFDSLLEANWDSQYAQRRQAIGQTHAEVGLDPQLFLGAYNQYVKHCFRHFAEAFGPEAQQSAEQLLPLMMVIFLDIGLTLNAYFFQATEKLRQALDMYWQANHDLRQFAQLTSHDLKTPIATIANLCDETLDEFGDQMPEEAKRLITAARQRTFQTSQMIDELLKSTLSFQSADSQEEFSSDAVIREALDRLGPEIAQKKIKVQLPASFPYVWGNRVRLREAFYNLLSNAVKFIEKRPGRIEIAVEVHESECIFRVSDNGPGIPPSELSQVFAPFRRLEQHRGEPGSGLGLYFTRQLVEQEGGRVWVESEVGVGSRFYIALGRSPDEKNLSH